MIDTKELLSKIAPPNRGLNKDPEATYYLGLSFVCDHFRVNGTRSFSREISEERLKESFTRMLSRENTQYTNNAVNHILDNGISHHCNDVGTFKIYKTPTGMYTVESTIQ